ncbi:Nucleosome assembly protein 1-like 1 [Fukomys damarensis]|uniref:Nucleosome assembly protein 1-like 1 n=1 Tax=Fukomys damarensis TaxID=885580 RepID=A0A091CR78_FUKDA|nr:Nucleosome assembly protein 1-like 1 [Fukomys damarensis]
MADIDNKEQSEFDQDLDDVEEVEEEETALQERLDGLVDTPAGYIESLPRVVKRNVNAPKNLQVKCAQIKAKFYEEVHDFERKYAVLYQPLFDKRFEIIKAIYEPNEEECEWKPDEEEEILEELKGKAKIEDEKKDEEKEDAKGIPEFWLVVFKNVDLLSDMVQEHDEPIPKHLKDIKVKFLDAGQPMKAPESGNLDDDVEAVLAADFEIGHFLPEHINPRSVLYFTGEAIEDDDDDDEGEETEEEGEEEGDEENNPDYDPKRSKTEQGASSSEAGQQVLQKHGTEEEEEEEEVLVAQQGLGMDGKPGSAN